jgi:leucyl/phenylalanyl-tRNA--protein transferase
MFFAESMYSAVSGGSKVALAALAHRLHEWGWPLIDAQVENEHLVSLGGERLPREAFQRIVADRVGLPVEPGPWTMRFGELNAATLADSHAG